MSGHCSRRSFSASGGTRAAALASLPPAQSVAAQSRWLGDAFKLCVALGDPRPKNVVLWTGLAVDPLADDRMCNVCTGTEAVTPRWRRSVHTVPRELQPDRKYCNRSRVDGHLPPADWTMEAPIRTSTGPLTMSVASCAQYEHGFFSVFET